MQARSRVFFVRRFRDARRGLADARARGGADDVRGAAAEAGMRDRCVLTAAARWRSDRLKAWPR